MSVPGTYVNTAVGFRHVHAYATAGSGYDTAYLEGWAGDDIFYGHPAESALYAGSGEYLSRTKAFEEVNATAGSGGSDVARLYDSPGDDLFVGTPEYGELSGNTGSTVFRLRASNFHGQLRKRYGVHAFATAGGDDKAELHDSPSDDIFYATTGEASLYNLAGPVRSYNRAVLFEQVEAFRRGPGDDVAQLHDSALNDLLRAETGLVNLSYGADRGIMAWSFPLVQFYHRDDGDDTIDRQTTLDYVLELHAHDI
jgi:hypothetical protein